jgi:glycosyltransferase involved in cell wall biosynthesis
MHARTSTSGGGEGRARILLLLSSLHGGGAERVAVHLLNNMDSERFDVRLGLLRGSGPWLAEADRSRILIAPGSERFVYEGTNSSFYRPDRLVAGVTGAPRAFRAMIRQVRPQVVMSFLKGTSLAVSAALAGLGAQRPRFIVREGNNTLAVINEELSNPFGRVIVRHLTARAYRAADCVLANSRDMAEGISRDLALDPAGVRVINNPIDLDRVRLLSREPLPEAPRRPFVLTVGRLEYQKAQDGLLRAYAASETRATHDLVLIGRGTLDLSLRALAVELGIAGQVRFKGFLDNPWRWMAKAELFLLPSRWEGFPTAAAEALAVGVPALLSDCPFGPRDVLEHGVSGWIVPPDDDRALRDAMDHLIARPALRSRLVEGGSARAESFGLAPMLACYEHLFAEQAALA